MLHTLRRKNFLLCPGFNISYELDYLFEIDFLKAASLPNLLLEVFIQFYEISLWHLLKLSSAKSPLEQWLM